MAAGHIVKSAFVAMVSVGSAASVMGWNAAQAPKPQRLQFNPLPKSAVHDVAFSRDDKLLAVACREKEILVYDASTGEVRLTLQTKTDRVRSVAFSPDGSLLVSGCGYPTKRPSEQGEIKVWDSKTGKELASMSGRGPIWKVGFTPDGKSIVSASSEGTIQIWDAAKGTETLALAEHKGDARTFAFSPDGKVFASGGFDGTVVFWDAKTFQKQKSFLAHPQGVQCVVFSPSGRTFVTCEWPSKTRDVSSVKIWDYASGLQISQVQGIAHIILSADFSPGERMLALGGGNQSKAAEVKVIEMASGKARAVIPGHKEWVEAIRFSPDGQLLVSGGGNSNTSGEIRSTYLVDLKPAPIKGELSAKEAEQLWGVLAGPDAAEAYRAICLLATAPAPTLEMLKERVRPPAPVNEKAVAKLIADLDNDTFQVREDATKALAELGIQAEPLMRKALVSTKSAEVRARLESVLANVGGASSKVLQMYRAIEVLESIGTPGAAAVLQQLADGPQDLRLTEEARATLKRMQKSH
jgi:WD40 repeat protein